MTSVTRWLWAWITVGVLVLVIVIGFLLAITRALSAIDDGLLEASTSVSAIGKDADPLPGAIQSINTNLTGTDDSLKQVPAQAGQISDGLGKIRDSLKLVDTSLKDTAGSLTDTGKSLTTTSSVLVGVAGSTGDIDRSLKDTTNILQDVRGRAGDIKDTLDKAETKDSRGTNLIPDNVKRINHVLEPAQDDTHLVVGQLIAVNQNLLGICDSPLLILLNPQCTK